MSVAAYTISVSRRLPSTNSTRESVAHFINANEVSEVIFTSGTTASINVVAQSYAGKWFSAGDEVLVSEMEHHANIVPWTMLAKDKGIVVRRIPITDDGDVDLNAFSSLVTKKTKLVAITALSNALGTINPIKKIVEIAHFQNALVLVDAAQAVAHQKIDVAEWGCDFLAFSGHKVFAPAGVGVLYGKRYLLEDFDPLFGGGDMIKSVSFERVVYADLPARLEAGTPAIGATIALGVALRYLQNIGLKVVEQHEADLLKYASAALRQIAGLRIIGNPAKRAGLLSFTIEGVHVHDVASILDENDIAIRAGHHCAQPLMDRLKISASARASFAFYNTTEDVDALVAGISKAKDLFR